MIARPSDRRPSNSPRRRSRIFSLAFLTAAPALLVAAPAAVHAGDWPQWGLDGTRNMVSPEKPLPTTLDAGKPLPGSEQIDPKTTRNVRWVQKLGSQSYGNTTVAGGRVYVGTNNESPREPALGGDRSVLMVFDEASGKFLWQLAVPKLGSGKVNDWELIGLTSSPTVEGNRVYLVTNRSEVLCLDAAGLADGNEGPFKEEGQYLAGPGKPPATVGKDGPDIVWRYDLREELGVFPHNATASSVLIVGDRLYVTTSNGVDWGHQNIPAPTAPALIVLDKKTGELVGEESSGISSRVFHSNWSSPMFAKSIGPTGRVVFCGGDGFCYGFLPEPVVDKEGLRVLKEVFRFDCDPPGYRSLDGKPIPYASYKGPSEVIATPVIHDGQVVVAIGQDPEHGSGIGNLSAFDPAKSGDLTTAGKRWSFSGMGRSISTVAIADGLVFAADFDGRVYCLDEKTGKLLWSHDTRSHIWSSPLVADHKVYLGNEEGTLYVFEAAKTKKIVSQIDMHAPIYASVVAANGVLYVATQTQLYAIANAK